MNLLNSDRNDESQRWNGDLGRGRARGRAWRIIAENLSSGLGLTKPKPKFEIKPSKPLSA